MVDVVTWYSVACPFCRSIASDGRCRMAEFHPQASQTRILDVTKLDATSLLSICLLSVLQYEASSDAERR